MEIVSTFFWYLYRVLNLPESIRQMNSFVLGIIILFVGFHLLLIILGLVHFVKHHSMKKLSLIILGSVWYVLFGLPHFLLPRHLSPHYLHTAAIGFFIAEAILLQSLLQKRTIVFFAFCFSYILMSFINVQYYHKTHWIVWRANIAKQYIEKTRNAHPTLPKGATVVFDSTAVSLDAIQIALYNNKALRLYYMDKTLDVFYGLDNTSDKQYFFVSD